MENVHGVDVSWLHNAPRDYQYRPQAPSSPGLTRDAPPPQSSHGGLPESPASVSETQKPPGAVATAEISASLAPPSPVIPKHPRRPTVLGRATSDRAHLPTLQSASSTKTSRRNSWITSLSSKFSSSNAAPQTATPAAAPGTPPAAKGEAHFTNPFDAAPSKTPVTNVQQEPAENLEPYVPLPPKQSNPGFFSSVARKLSASGPQTSGLGKVEFSGAVAPRRVLNIDKSRHRGPIKELDQSRLRRVSFCVDVEITNGPKYKDEEDSTEKKKKAKDRKLKDKGEGAALKNPDAVRAQKESTGIIQASGEHVGAACAAGLDGKGVDGLDASPQTGKKKPVDGALEKDFEISPPNGERNGNMKLDGGTSGESKNLAAIPAAPAPRPQERPTTDPLRIYRRCCQLRETPILKRISDQLQNKANLDEATPGVVVKLDLTGSRMVLADMITLGDWLAVVPVKTLLVEDSELTDEGVRVILSGLLAAKVPLPIKSRKRGPDQQQQADHLKENPGVIEKLTLKNNPRVTREGWRYISCFLYNSRSLKALDVSMIPFPGVSVPTVDSPPPGSKSHWLSNSSDIAELLSRALSERLAGARFEELTIAECGLDSDQLRKVISAVRTCRVKRLSLARNGIDGQGLEDVLQYMRSGLCEGIDLGGTDLRNKTRVIADAVRDCHSNPLWALSLADCNLDPTSLEPLFPALVALPNFRFIDLSHNRELFSTHPNALSLLRKYIPRFPILRRIHLRDVSLTPRQAIGLFEVLPENASLAHLNILENPELSELACATDEARQEEACAFYASLMAAVRVSKTLMCVDVSVPSQETSEIVRALCRQVVAYCLRNLEAYTAAEDSKSAEAKAAVLEPYGGKEDLAVSDVLVRLIGHVDGLTGEEDSDQPAPDDDYIVGGTGVVKALSYCLSEKAADLRRTSTHTSGTATPKPQLLEAEVGKTKAKEMSKNLLDSARRIRARLPPALIKEANAGNDMAHRRLVFLDETLQGIIQRFEDEYPECRLEVPKDTRAGLGLRRASSTSVNSLLSVDPPASDAGDSILTDSMTSPNGVSEEYISSRPVLNHGMRHDSEVMMASRALELEEGEMHRFGQGLYRDLFRPQRLDHAHGTTGAEIEPEHVQVLRAKLEALKGEDIREQVAKEGGWEAVAKDIVGQADDLKQMMKKNPDEFERLAKSLTADKEVVKAVHEIIEHA